MGKNKNGLKKYDNVGYLFVLPDALALFTKVHGRRLHLILKENTGNIVGSFALDGQSERMIYTFSMNEVLKLLACES